MDFKKERIQILGGGWYKVTLVLSTGDAAALPPRRCGQT